MAGATNVPDFRARLRELRASVCGTTAQLGKRPLDWEATGDEHQDEETLLKKRHSSRSRGGGGFSVPRAMEGLRKGSITHHQRRIDAPLARVTEQARDTRPITVVYFALK